MNTQTELQKVANHLILNLPVYSNVEEKSLHDIKISNYYDVTDQRKQLKHFLNHHMFSDSGISVIYDYVEEQLNK